MSGFLGKGVCVWVGGWGIMRERRTLEQTIADKRKRRLDYAAL